MLGTAKVNTEPVQRLPGPLLAASTAVARAGSAAGFAEGGAGLCRGARVPGQPGRGARDVSGGGMEGGPTVAPAPISAPPTFVTLAQLAGLSGRQDFYAVVVECSRPRSTKGTGSRHPERQDVEACY